MNVAPEAPLDLSVFDEEFFANQLADVDIQAVAQQALAGILTLQGEDQSIRTYEQIAAESEVFFANPVVRETENMLGSLAAQYALFCTHNHGGLSTLTSGNLGGYFKIGKDLLGPFNYLNGHDEDEDDDHKGHNH